LNLRKLDKENWFRELRRWRDQVTHISLLPMLFTVGVGVDNKPKVFFRDHPDKQVIPFLETYLQKVKDLLQEIINNEPLLR
jgi:hypothetical protein